MDKIEEVINKLSINEKIEFLRGINFWETKKDDRFNYDQSGCWKYINDLEELLEIL